MPEEPHQEEEVHYSLQPDGACVLGGCHVPIQTKVFDLASLVFITGWVCKNCGVPLIGGS